MEWVKTTAKTLPEAIDLALDNLGVDEAEAEIKVLEEPRTGLFGRTRGIARVEARVKPKQSRPKAERGRNRRDGEGGRNRNRKQSGQKRSNDRGSNDSASNDTSSDETSQSSENSGSTGNKKNQGGGRSGNNRNGSGRERSADRGKSEDGNRSQSRSSGRRSKGSGDAKASSGNKAENRSKSSSGPKKNREAAVPIQDASVEEVSAHLDEFLKGLTAAFGFDSAVAVDLTEDEALVGRVEDQIGLMVGPKGRTLDAVQELARISCQRAVPSSIRIRVDVGGYREKRAAALGDFARSAADRAVADGTEVALEPMSAADRKAVHDALNEDDRVETRSIGVDPRRRIVVVPAAGSDDVDADEEE